MVRTLRYLLVAALTLVAPSFSYGATIAKGVAAFESGDFSAALGEFIPLAEQGVSGAQYSLGRMYDEGLGVIENDKEAVKWYRLAAAQGATAAQYSLGEMFRLGEGVIQDNKKAVKWYLLAAEQEDRFAQNALGVMYMLGLGVIQDNVRAHMWLNISASQGHEKARKTKELLIEKMTRQDISKAQDLARECVKSDYKGC